MMKVLVVDDNRNLADLIRSVLEEEGMEVMSAYDGAQGYSGYLFFRPDLVITDIQMPGGSGFEMMQKIRAQDPMIKTVYMSGNIDAHWQSIEQEKERYPVTIFRKPFSLASLTQLLSAPA